MPEQTKKIKTICKYPPLPVGVLSSTEGQPVLQSKSMCKPYSIFLQATK